MTESNLTRRHYLYIAGSAALAGATGTASADDTTPVETAPLPSDADGYTYGTMGDDGPIASVFGNFKCPHTREFMIDNLEDVVQEFVEPGRLRLRFRSLAYEPFPEQRSSHGSSTYFISSSDPRIARVALGVWNVDPDAYWEFVVNLFRDQPSGTVSYDELDARMREAGVSGRDRVIALAKDDRYEDELLQNRDRFEELDMHHTPRLSLGGEVKKYPQKNVGNVLDWLEERVPEADSGGSSSSGSSESSSSSESSDSSDSDDSDAEESSGSSSGSSVGSVEFGTVRTDQNGRDDSHRVSLDGSYDSPVVIAKTISSEGPHPCHVRLRDVDDDAFSASLEEWLYLDGSHRTESFGYTVFDGGVDSLDGLQVEVGRTTVEDDDPSQVRFDRSFSTTPVVFAQSQTRNGWHPIVTRVSDVSTDGMSVRIDEEDASSGAHYEETVGYVAIEPGSGSVDGHRFEVGFAGEVDEDWSFVPFDRYYDDPAFVAGMQTYRGWNASSVRYDDLDKGGVDVHLDEEQSDDPETGHVEERLGYFVADS